jgi:hypothetical protein
MPSGKPAWVEFRLNIRLRWARLLARGLTIIEGQLALDILEDGPEPTILVARAVHGAAIGEPHRCEIRAQTARVVNAAWLEWLPDARRLDPD